MDDYDLEYLTVRGQGRRSWIRVDRSGNRKDIEVDWFTIMHLCHLPARDLRLLDPQFGHSPTIVGRETVILINLEKISCIISADEVLLFNSFDSYVLRFVEELQNRLKRTGSVTEMNPKRISRSTYSVYLPFEFRALAVALRFVSQSLRYEAVELQVKIYPLIDELTSKISTLNLERIRILKSRLVALTRKVQKIREEIELLMDDDGDMAEMYLTEKKSRMGSSFYGDHSLMGFRSNDGLSVSAPVSPVSSPRSRGPQKRLTRLRSRHKRMKSTESSDSNVESIEELEMLLESYFVSIDITLNSLVELKEYIDDTENWINIQQDDVRNKLIQVELLLTTATFILAIFGIVVGIFGMNFPIRLFDEPGAFKWVLIITSIGGMIIFGAFVWFFKRKRIVPLY